MYRKMLELLTDNYNKDINSNIGKLFRIIGHELEELRDVFNRILEWCDIDKAKGKALERIGDNVLQRRPADFAGNDELYRLLIKTKIIANLSRGDIETINEIATAIIGEGLTSIQETWNLPEFGNEPAGLVFTMTSKARIMPSIIMRATAGGIATYWILIMKEDSRIHISSSPSLGEGTILYPKIETGLFGTLGQYIGSANNMSEGVVLYPEIQSGLQDVLIPHIANIVDTSENIILYPGIQTRLFGTADTYVYNAAQSSEEISVYPEIKGNIDITETTEIVAINTATEKLTLYSRIVSNLGNRGVVNTTILNTSTERTKIQPRKEVA